MPPANDPSIPEDDQMIKRWVILLRDAMLDMSAYEDRPTSKFKRRWLPLDYVEGTLPQPGDILTNPYYPQHWLEEKCWQIVVCV